ncbi:MAG: tetratricopeptide repeat protein [Candidatus Competibacteraceae bacterium]|nr:tetratricopeptide repeat protein [Candidatus Competibacteraceae bacterium]
MNVKVSSQAKRNRWWVMLTGLLLLLLAACGGPALTPLQAQYQREQERALRYHARGELPRALQAYQDSLRWAEIADDRAAIVTQALNLGTVALALGEWALAESSFQQAQRTAVELRNVASEWRARLGLAQVSLRQGRFEAALTAFQHALAEVRERDTAAALVALNGLGLAHQGLEQWSDAYRALREAEILARAHGNERLLAATLANQAALALRTGQFSPAATRLDEAIALDRNTENLPGLAQDLALLARVREQMGDGPGALDLYRQARIIARHTGQFLPVESGHRVDRGSEGDSSGRLQPGGLKSAEQSGLTP